MNQFLRKNVSAIWSDPFVKFLGVIYFLTFILAALRPPHVLEWWLDNIVVICFWVLVFRYQQRWRLSRLSYLMIFILLEIHVVGAYYVYENVPLGFWCQEWFGWQRNHFDRLAHFCFGLLFALPLWELCERNLRLQGFALWFFPVSVILSLSALYELLEALVVQLVDPEAGSAFLGSQGDVWDAHSDILVALIGSMLTVTCAFNFRDRKSESPTSTSHRTGGTP